MTAIITFDENKSHISAIIEAKIFKERAELWNEGYTQEDSIVDDLAKLSIRRRTENAVKGLRERGFATVPFIIKETKLC